MKSPLLFQNQPVHEISDAENKVLVSSDHGARILRWEKAGREIITWPNDADWSKILKVRGGNPILFPFVGRHFVEGKNEFWRDTSGTVRAMPQHGFARDAKFTAVEGEPGNGLRMRLTDSAQTQDYYPFNFRFDVVISLLSSSRLEIRFETTNLGNDPLPYYSGHHFYLALPHRERANWTLHLPCRSWGRQTPDGVTLKEKPTSSELNVGDPNLIDRYHIEPKDSTMTLKNTRTGSQLVFKMEHAGSIPWYAVTTWAEKPDSDYYCVEPWVGIPNAIHHGEGLRWLVPRTKEVATLVLDGSRW